MTVLVVTSKGLFNHRGREYSNKEVFICWGVLAKAVWLFIKGKGKGRLISSLV